jgi:hypothetical protein
MMVCCKERLELKSRLIAGIMLTMWMLVAVPLAGVSFETVDFVAQSGVHDVALINVTLSKTVVGQGYSMRIFVTVENQGNFTETFGVAAPYYEGVVIPTSVQWKTFWSMGDVDRNGYINEKDLQLIYDRMGTGDPDADLNQDGIVDTIDLVTCAFHIGEDIWTHFGLPLPPTGTQRGVKLYSGSQTTLTLTWNTTGFAKGNYTISANATIVSGETDTADNIYIDGTVRVNMAGDVTPEYGIVDIVDIVYVAIHFGSQKGDPNYEPNADINCDGLIDIVDIVIVAIHFGETDP